jgi:hypothetical protein
MLETVNPTYPVSCVADYVRLSTRFRMEPHEPPGGAIYIPGLSEGMTTSCELFELFGDYSLMYRSSGSHVYDGHVFANGANGQFALDHGWPGFDEYKRQLMKFDVPESYVHSTDVAVHTRSEADTMISFAKERGIEYIVVASVIYHWEKIAVCMLGAMVRQQYFPRVYFVRPDVVHFDHMMNLGSQGSRQNVNFLDEAGIYFETFVQHLVRGQEDEGCAWVTRYGAPVDLVLRYLDWRDNGGDKPFVCPIPTAP